MNKVPNVIKKWSLINAYRLLPIVILSNNANTYVIDNVINKKRWTVLFCCLLISICRSLTFSC